MEDIIIVDNKLCNNRDNRTYDPVKTNSDWQINTDK